MTALGGPAKPISDGEKAQLLEQWMTTAKSLQGTHEMISRQVNEVEEKLSREELRRGQTIQQYLDLGRALKRQEQHIGDDKAKLEDLRQRKDKASEEIGALVAQIGGLVLDMKNGREE